MSSGGSSSSAPRQPASRIAPPSTMRKPITTTGSGIAPPSAISRGSSSASTSASSSKRTPMANMTSRATNTAPAAGASRVGNATSSTGLRKPMASSVSIGAKRAPSALSSAPAKRTASSSSSSSSIQRPVPSSSSSDIDDGVTDLAELQRQVYEMAAMFDREKETTATARAKDQLERKQYEEKVMQLEESLEEQKRLAKESKRESGRRRTLFDDEMAQLRQSHARERRMWEEDLERERQTVRALKDSMTNNSTANLTMESTNVALRTELQAAQDRLRERETQIATLTATVASHNEMVSHLENELREAESLRRKLHNEVQELRGNIRVFARVRPSLPSQAASTLATLRFPNKREARELEVLSAGESATGTATMRSFGFEFDRVFGPEASQRDVFDEVQHLMQSVLDGYNTCIFAYGQTGSGKTHTLEGSGLPDANFSSSGSNSSSNEGAGLIPRAVEMLFSTAENLKGKDWKYEFEGSMLEIYNDGINDLLGKGKFDEVKHEIKHEKGRTVVSESVVIPLSTPSQVFALLSKASNKRSVAATLMNERSSRSHSIFTLRVQGRNSSTAESCDATLSLVDLAGSERLANSGSGDDPKRLKEAVSINKSLSSLADVISALGAGKPNAHIPYRNSTLTWLLKNSLGGNSKTLMLLALSPMQEHLNESLCSLRFASKVNSTVIGTAKRVRNSSD
ncbi:unnamed protein product [Sympodiomycopsis kandeliae]